MADTVNDAAGSKSVCEPNCASDGLAWHCGYPSTAWPEMGVLQTRI